jgi:3-deoxy-manno-octulosonate cytidylyltransferase (CMP-KDO synthetase)
MTSPDCASGSDRAAEVARARPDAEIVVNLQGDEPNLDPTVIDRVVEALIAAPDCAVATAAAPIRDETEFPSPHVVKVVLDAAGRALYFSRSPLPSPARLAPADRAPPDFIWGLKHLGLYAFRREALLDFAAAAPAPLERRESLEQLRLLERGARIKVVRVEADSIGVDTPADLERLQRSASASRSAPRAPRAKE